MTEVVIKTFSLSYVCENDRILLNVNNLYGDTRPDDYYQSQSVTEKFIHQFHHGKFYRLDLTPDDLKWMKKAQLINYQTGTFPSIYLDDLEDSCKRHKAFMDELLVHGSRWFIRTEHFSLKYGLYGVGPYDSLKKILPSIITYVDGHSCLTQEDETKSVYFLPWIDFDKLKEFRVFVFDNRVTAISQQFLYEENTYLKELSTEQLKSVARKIVDAHYNDFREKLQYLGGKYVMDVALIGDDEVPYFIEVNSFGAFYSAGSSLFHWINDADILEGKAPLEFRFVDKL